MDQAAQGSLIKKTKKTLRLKVALIIALAVTSPYILGLFIPLTALVYILVAAASAILAIILLLWVLRPLDLFIKSTRVFSDGNLNHRINLQSGDEFEDVGDSFNLMAEKLSAAIQKLENDEAIAVSEKNKFDEILSSIIDGIIALDFNKNIMFLNKASEELTGFRESDVLGKSVDQAIHLFSEQEEILPKTYCQESFNQTARLVGKNGKQTKVSLTTTQVGSAVQTNLNCILIIHDLSREEELEQMKLDFVSMASHELKTPLTSIVGYLSVFLDENKGKIPAESLNLLNKAFVAAKQLQTLIQNLLNVNKIEKEQLSVSPQPTDYLPILTKTVEDLKSQATQKNIVLNMLLPTETLPKVITDPIRINEVITNLVSNAINYTNPNGKIEVSVKVSPNDITTTISDNGVGIPQEAIPHLFSKFFRVSNKLQQASKGTGLGLYISKSIVEKLHGKIWVESEPGKGSRFSFTLPIVTLSTAVSESNKFVSGAIQSGTLNY
ncbi:MAG: ATP-binding protein [Candidatus Daviesbacteria bacterium]|nr:ATP-binding protein [Candidatus Daviesbacteria bacterium]